MDNTKKDIIAIVVIVIVLACIVRFISLIGSTDTNSITGYDIMENLQDNQSPELMNNTPLEIVENETVDKEVSRLPKIKYDLFDGETTDFDKIEDKKNVEKAVIEKREYGKIRWKNKININGQDLNQHIKFGHNFISVDSSALDPSINSSATLVLYGLDITDPVILKDGAICDTCSIEDYTGGTLTFSVTGFSNYTATSDANLTIWDSTDIEEGNEIKYANSDVFFYANYTLSNGTIIADTIDYNGSCLIRFNISGWGADNIMIFNTTRNSYEYNYSFNAKGNYQFNITCNSSVSSFYISGLDDFNITNTAPNITWVESGISVNPAESSVKQAWITFNATDPEGIANLNDSTAKIELTLENEIQRNSTICIAMVNDTAAKNRQYNCSVDMQYYDKDGNWLINASVRDISGELSYNDSITIAYGQLQAVRGNTDGITFGNLVLGETANASNDPLILDNTGNQNFTFVNITAYDLRGQEKSYQYIPAGSFFVNSTDDALGQGLVNNTAIQISNALLPRDINGIDNNSSIYLWAQVPDFGLSAQNYLSNNNWIIEVFP